MFIKIIGICLLIIASISIPKGWKALRGPGVRQFSDVLFAEGQSPPDEAAYSALSQPYFYWNKGRQCDVFLSRDGQFVLKIPRLKRTRKSEDLETFKIANSFFFSEAALLYVHYGDCIIELPADFALYDRLQRHMKVDLPSHPFVLQFRAKLLRDALDQADNRDEVEQLLMQFLNLIATEKKKGWMSKDSAFSTNFGVRNQQVIRIDIGDYAALDDSRFSWQEIVKPVHHYLQRKDLLLWTWFEQQIEK